MLLGTEAIRAGLDSGAIICDPMPSRIEGAHIDVTLGRHYWTWRVGGREWPALDLRDADPAACFVYREGDDSIEIPARGLVLAHTAEFIGTAPGSGLLPTLSTRSTLARWGIGAHPSAGWGDIGYASIWTLEIVNPHPVAIALPVGARVGCIAFHRVEGVAADYTPGTRYNVTRQGWTPDAMLPRKGNW